MNATRTKRWNGKFDKLPADYLKEVIAKMMDYGDRVQFSLISSAALPSYQITNALDKKIAFDGNHHLLSPKNDEFSATNASTVFTLEQIKSMSAGTFSSTGTAKRPAAGTRAAANNRVTAAKLNEQFAAQRYEYFKNNRGTLPPTIADYSAEITELMKSGKSVEEAFDEVLKKHF